jgi:hypothetical protein
MSKVVYKWKWVSIHHPARVYYDLEGEDLPDATTENVRDEEGRITSTLIESRKYFKSSDLCADHGMRHIPPVTILRLDYLLVQAYPIHAVDEWYALEYERLKTFTHWPKYMQPNGVELAKAGFYYLGQSDRVKCFTCGLVLRNWKPTDNARNEHATHTTDCSFLTED